MIAECHSAVVAVSQIHINIPQRGVECRFICIPQILAGLGLDVPAENQIFGQQTAKAVRVVRQHKPGTLCSNTDQFHAAP